MRIIFIKICPYKGHAKDSVRDAAGSENKLQVSLPPLQPRLKKKYIPECIVGILKSHRHLLPTPDVHTADTPPPPAAGSSMHWCPSFYSPKVPYLPLYRQLGLQPEVAMTYIKPCSGSKTWQPLLGKAWDQLKKNYKLTFWRWQEFQVW